MQAPTLIDFDLATTFAEERPAFTHESEIVGTLAYLAPEQTGRTGRPVDQRADLYALGATLYALATGRLRCSARTPLQLIHDHLARVPTRLAGEPWFRSGLSAVILRLLEKEPDRRYQSAAGLAHDLRPAARRCPATGAVALGAGLPAAVGRTLAAGRRPPSEIQALRDLLHARSGTVGPGCW